MNSIENDDWTERGNDDEEDDEDGDNDVLQTQSSSAGRKSKQRTVKTMQAKGETDTEIPPGSGRYVRASNVECCYTHPYDFLTIVSPPHLCSVDDSECVNEADERTHLLPPSGISTNEHSDRSRNYLERHHIDCHPGISHQRFPSDATSDLRGTMRINNTAAALAALNEYEACCV